MTSLPDLFAAQFPQPSPELLAWFAVLEALPARMDAMAEMREADYTELSGRINTIVAWLNEMRVDVARLDVRVTALEGDPPVPPPDLDTVHVGAAIRVNELIAGWHHTQQSTYPLSVSQQVAIAYASPAQGEHLQGFGTGAVWPSPAGPKQWASLDRIYGPPGHPEQGVMKDAKVRVLVAMACPAWMKLPKAGTTLTQDYPVGDATAEFNYQPPHRSHYPDYADLIAEAVVRYDIDVLVPWNEGKGWWSNTLRRWSYENFTEYSNIVATKVHAAKPDCLFGGPYWVLRTLSWIEPGHHSKELTGPWGSADTQALDVLEYFIAHGMFDFIAMDVRNSNSDYSQGDIDAPNWPMNVWQTNPEKGVNPNYWPVSPSESWAKLDAFMVWLRKRTDKPVWMMEFYANTRLNNKNANFPTHVPSSIQEMVGQTAEGLIASARAGLAGILQWRVQGDSKGRANPLALYNTAKENTALVDVCGQFAASFPPGTQLYDVTVDDPVVIGIASDTALCLVSRFGGPLSFTFKGEPLVLAAHDVKFVAR